MPKLAIAAALLALAALAGALSYAVYLAVDVLAGYLGTSRFVAGLLLGVFFARLPWIDGGRLRTIGLLPKRARIPVMVSLLALCLLSFFYRGEVVPVLFLGFAATFLLACRWMKKAIISRTLSLFFKPTVQPNRPGSMDNDVIDVEFQEKK